MEGWVTSRLSKEKIVPYFRWPANSRNSRPRLDFQLASRQESLTREEQKENSLLFEKIRTRCKRASENVGTIELLIT
jgi:hypothetical protein